MLQQTRMEVVLSRFADFLQRFPTLETLAGSSEDEVTAAWSGLGYYRRARMLRSGAIDVMERCGGRLPSSVDALMSIDGVGRYTAGAIASIAYEQRAPIVDGNVARIVARLFATHRDAWTYATALVEDAASPRAFNQALMEIGALICKPRNPECTRCPLRTDCSAFQRDAVHRFPKVARKKMTDVTLPLFVVTDRRGRLLLRRETGRLMNGLFVLPDRAAHAVYVAAFRHTITNRRVTFEVYTAAAGRRPAASHIWADPAKLAEIPHPSYVRKALRLAGIV